MFRVVQVKNGFVFGVWFQSAENSNQAIESVKAFYAKNVSGSHFFAEEV